MGAGALRLARSGTTLFGTGYLRDSLGRITQLTDSAREAGGTLQVRRWSYVYDGVGRLLRDSLDGTLHQAFAYDSNGNRTSLTTLAGTVSYGYDAQDRLTRSATSGGVVTLYSYGSNGELKTKTDSATGAQTRYQYDALGNLLKVVLPSGDSVEYLIDGQNRRVGRKWNGAVTHRWLYQNQLNPIAELDSAGALVSRFVYGSRANVPDYLVRGGAVYRLVTDHLGSVRAVVDTSTGSIAQWTAYDAWGNVLADSGAGFQPFGFAGGLTDSVTGLVRFGARDYDPAVGRWTAKDPVGFLGRGPSLFTYVDGDPINAIDPTGLIRCGQTFAGGFGIVTGVGGIAIAVVAAGAASPVVVGVGVIGGAVSVGLGIANVAMGLLDRGTPYLPGGPGELAGAVGDALGSQPSGPFSPGEGAPGPLQKVGSVLDMIQNVQEAAGHVLPRMVHTGRLEAGSPFGPLSQRIPALQPF